MLKILCTAAAAGFLATHGWSQLVDNFNDIDYWAGSGTRQSALVLQWNDGLAPASVAWGYRWDGTATGIDLLTAVAGTTIIREPSGGGVVETLSGADPALVLTIERYGWGDAVYSMVYSPGGVTRTQADWGSGYWEYSLYAGDIDYFTWDGTGFAGPFNYNAAGSADYGSVSWWPSQVGAADRLLVDGSWDAWSFAAGFTGVPVVQPVPAAVPEPRVAALLAAACWLWALSGGKRRRAE